MGAEDVPGGAYGYAVADLLVGGLVALAVEGIDQRAVGGLRDGVDRQVAPREVFVEHEGQVQPAPAPRFSRTSATLSHPPAPGAGAHTREGLTAWGIADVDGLKAINDRFGSDDWTPVVLHVDDDFPRSVALMRRADVADVVGAAGIERRGHT